MPGWTEAMAFMDCYKHMECLCGIRLQSFLMVTLFTRAMPGTPASGNIKVKRSGEDMLLCMKQISMSEKNSYETYLKIYA